MRYLEFWERFLEAEAKADVFNIKTVGYQLYPMLRTRLYYQLAQQLGIFDNPHPNPEPKDQPASFQSPLELGIKSEIFVVPFVRTIGGVDVYSQPIVEELGARASVLPVSDPAANLDLERIKAWAKDHFDRKVFDMMLKEKVRDVRDRWAVMAELFQQTLGTDLGKFTEFPNWLVRRYVSECMGFKEFFESAGTKKLYIVNAYSHPSVVTGAKQAGVKVIEIQHGFISEYHPAYSYPATRIQAAPNGLLVWGDYWRKAAKFPKGMKAITTGPSLAFLKQRSQIDPGKRVAKTIMFTSQGAVGLKLFEQAIHWANKLSDWQITFRLHPNEDLADFQKVKLPKNLSLSHKTPTFLELLSTHEYLVGGFSTTLYEGLSFGLKVIVLPLDGFENVNQAIANGDMALAPMNPGVSELVELLQSSKVCHNPYSYYAKDLNVKKALRA